MNKSSPLFITKETENDYKILANIKGYKREHVDIEINEDGTRISITVEKPVQEKVLSGRLMNKKDVEAWGGFRKVFRIPDGVALNRIKAKFNDEESTLKVVMPKLVKGIVGVGIQEVMESVDVGRAQMTQAASEDVPEKSGVKTNMEESSYKTIGTDDDKEESLKDITVHDHHSGPMESEKTEELNIAKTEKSDVNEKKSDGKKEGNEAAKESIKEETPTEKPASGPEKKDVDNGESSQVGKDKDVDEKSTLNKLNKLRTPLIIAGSALLVSFVLLAIRRFRNRKK